MISCNLSSDRLSVKAKKGLINIEKREARNYYYDKVD